MSEDKVRTKDSCLSVGTIYDPRELPGVSTVDPGIGRGVTINKLIQQMSYEKSSKVNIIGSHT
jgi:hypothetical protein